ncbi:MAG: DUF5689 domain-containing protein [Muribaculaceae bacterium]
MKSFKLYLSLLLLMTLGLSSCQDDFDMPPMRVPVAKKQANTTISAVKAKYWKEAKSYVDSIKEPLIIKGTVISSDATGNIYKSLIIQDKTGALAMSINANSMYTTYRPGQEVVIDLNNMYIGKYAGLQQLGAPQYSDKYGEWQTTFMAFETFQKHAELNGLPNISKIDTIPAVIGQLPTLPDAVRTMQSQLVSFDNVEFEGGGTLKYSEPDASTSRTLKDAQGNTIIVRNSNYATFKNDILPKGKGKVVGILSYFNNAWQLLLRSTADCIGFQSGNTQGTIDNPYTMENVLKLQGKGSGWMTGYIVGAVAPEVTTVKSNADIQWKSGTDLANTIVIGATPETKDIKDCIIMELPQGSPMRAALNLVDNASVYKKQVWVNGTFASYLGAAGVTKNPGQVGDFKIEGITPPPVPGGDGNGTATSPFTINQILGGSTGSMVWVKGYIVGYVEGMVLNAEGAKFGASTGATKVYSNILMSADPATKDYKKCIPVQLPSGDARTALNVVDNPANIGKEVSVKGNVEKYFGTDKALKGVAEYNFGGDAPVPEPIVPVTSLNENFEDATTITSLTGWESVTIAGDKSWYIYTYKAADKVTVINKYASMTGYKGKAPFESWLITPPLNVAGASSKILSFETLVNGYGSISTTFEVYVLSSNDPKTATKTKLNATLATPPATGYSVATSSGNIDLSSYGKQVFIGFCYKATDDKTAAWGVDNVKFGL